MVCVCINPVRIRLCSRECSLQLSSAWLSLQRRTHQDLRKSMSALITIIDYVIPPGPPSTSVKPDLYPSTRWLHWPGTVGNRRRTPNNRRLTAVCSPRRLPWRSTVSFKRVATNVACMRRVGNHTVCRQSLEPSANTVDCIFPTASDKYCWKPPESWIVGTPLREKPFVRSCPTRNTQADCIEMYLSKGKRRCW